jgi:hypothetical protein
MKPVEIVLRSGRGKGRMMEGINPTKIYFKHISKFHNVSTCANIICQLNNELKIRYQRLAIILIFLGMPTLLFLLFFPY